MENQKTFRSRISVLLVVFTLAIFIPTGIHVFSQNHYQAFYGLGGTLLFVIFILCGMRYTISRERLYVKLWFIPYGSREIKDIVSVKRTYNPLSSPAASLKRLSIHCKSSLFFLLISPVREAAFIEELKAINPNIEVHIPETTGIWRFWDLDI